VQDEPFHTDACSSVGERLQGVEVVVEVDRFPGVEYDRSGARGVVGARAQPTVHACGHAVESLVGPGEVHPRGAVGLPPGEPDLSGAGQFTTGKESVGLSGALGEPFGQMYVVTAPGRVYPPHLASAEPEAGRSRDQEQRGVMAATSSA